MSGNGFKCQTATRCRRPVRTLDRAPQYSRDGCAWAERPLEYWMPRSSRGTTAEGVTSHSRGTKCPGWCIVIVPRK